MLFLALCDNVRVNSESLETARQLFDRLSNYESLGSCIDDIWLPLVSRSMVPDLESSLCARQRNHLREVFMAASEVHAYSTSLNYMLLITSPWTRQSHVECKIHFSELALEVEANKFVPDQ